VSTSLQYVPDIYNSTRRSSLATVAARYGGVYFSHQRSEGTGSTPRSTSLPDARRRRSRHIGTSRRRTGGTGK